MNNILGKTLLTSLKQNNNNSLNLLKLSLSTENDLDKKLNNTSNNNKDIAKSAKSTFGRSSSFINKSEPINTNITNNINNNNNFFKKEIFNNNENKMVVDFLNSKSINFYSGWNNFNLSVCPKSTGQFFMNSITGDFNCLKCKRTGSLNDFEVLYESFEKNENCFNIQDNWTTADKQHYMNKTSRPVNADFLKLWKQSKTVKLLNNTNFKILLKNSNLEGDFFKSVFEQHDIRIINSKVLFPVYDDGNMIIDLAPIETSDHEEAHLNKELIYGTECLKSIDEWTPDTIFITDKIKNLLAISQKVKRPTIVLNSLESLSSKLLAYLEKFDSVVIWQSDTKFSFELACALNHKRCFLINNHRSPFESMLLKEDLNKIVQKEQFPIKNTTIIKFDFLKDRVFDEIVNAKKLSGLQWKRFPLLNEILKGHRAGELTIFTGPTGSGKTTFLSEYSLDLITQGLSTMWGSFEIKNHRLVKMMMTQFSGLNLNKNVQYFEAISKNFAKLPIYFMHFHGQETLENVLKTMSNAVVLHDIKHVIIDNLQFMIGTQFPNSYDRFLQQDLIIAEFRKFATNFNCHVTVVIHPKKEDSNELLKISSIFGSAKSTQEADNVIILQEHRPVKDDASTYFKFIEVCKNRYDGELGKMGIKFDREKLSFITKKHSDRKKALENENEPATASAAPNSTTGSELFRSTFAHEDDEFIRSVNLQNNLTNSNEVELIDLKKFPINKL